MGFDFEGDDQPPASEALGNGHAFGLDAAQIEAFGAALDEGSSAGLMLIEHVWARHLRAAVRKAGGFPLGEGFLTPETLALVGAEVIAMAEALDEETANGG